MACKVIMMEIAKSGGIHVSESCPLGWLSPTKISSTMDFDVPCAQEASPQANMSKERSSDRDSISEFEFSMSTIKHENAHGEHMLAADELFFKGKLLPFYNPSYANGSKAQQAQRCDMCIQANHQILSSDPTSSCSFYTSNAANLQAITRDSTAPTSSKAPKRSIMLKELFGLKKMAKSICACTASGEVATGSSHQSSRCVSKEGKAAKSKQKASLILQTIAPPSACKARHLSWISKDAECITAKARNSASEPLLNCCVTQLPADSCTNTFDIACIHRSNSVTDSLCTHKDPQALSDHDEDDQCRRLSGDMSYEKDTCRPLTREQRSKSTRSHSGPLNPEKIAPSFEGDTCRRLAAKHLRGVIKGPPTRVASGESSPERQIPCRNLSYGINTSRTLTTTDLRREGEGARIKARMLNHNIGATSPESGSGNGLIATRSHLPQSKTLKITETLRIKSLERSSSYSPKSLQRKYEQLKAMRQREGWRMLERSSSYNSGMLSMRVAPVLNVPIVCISRSKSFNHGTHTRRKA